MSTDEKNRQFHSELSKAIELAGGQEELGEICGISQQAVSYWFKTLTVPGKKASKISNHFEGEVSALVLINAA